MPCDDFERCVSLSWTPSTVDPSLPTSSLLQRCAVRSALFVVWLKKKKKEMVPTWAIHVALDVSVELLISSRRLDGRVDAALEAVGSGAVGNRPSPFSGRWPGPETVAVVVPSPRRRWFAGDFATICARIFSRGSRSFDFPGNGHAVFVIMGAPNFLFITAFAALGAEGDL